MKKNIVSNNWLRKGTAIFLLVFISEAMLWAQESVLDDYVQVRPEPEVITYNSETGWLTYHGLNSFNMKGFVDQGFYFETFHIQWGVGPCSSDTTIQVSGSWKKKISTHPYTGQYYVRVLGVGFNLKDDGHMSQAQVPLQTRVFTFCE